MVQLQNFTLYWPFPADYVHLRCSVDVFRAQFTFTTDCLESILLFCPES